MLPALPPGPARCDRCQTLTCGELAQVECDWVEGKQHGSGVVTPLGGGPHQFLVRPGSTPSARLPLLAFHCYASGR